MISITWRMFYPLWRVQNLQSFKALETFIDRLIKINQKKKKASEDRLLTFSAVRNSEKYNINMFSIPYATTTVLITFSIAARMFNESGLYVKQH